MTVTTAPTAVETPAAAVTPARAGTGSKVMAWLILLAGLAYFFTPLIAHSRASSSLTTSLFAPPPSVARYLLSSVCISHVNTSSSDP